MFNDMKVGLRFALSFGLMVALMFALIAVGLNSMSAIDKNLQTVVTIANVRTQLANDLIDNTREGQIEVRNLILETGSDKVKGTIDTIAALKQAYDVDFNKYEALIPKDNIALLDLVSTGKAASVSAIESRDKLVDLVTNGKDNEALVWMNSDTLPKTLEWITQLKKLITYENTTTLIFYNNAKKEYSDTRNIFLIIGVVTLLLALVIAFVLSRSIIKPLKIAANLITSRDLTQDSAAYSNGRNELAFTVQSLRKDIAERTKLEEEMIASSVYARNLIEASLDPLVIINPDGKVTDVNKASEQATGLAREKLIGTDFSSYFTEPDKADAGYKKVLFQGSLKDYPLTLRHVSGRTIDVLYNASVYRDESGKTLGIFAAARDVTEQSTLTAQLLQHRANLEATVTQRTEALTGLLKEVNEAVNVLSSSTEEIAAAATQIAATATETAAAVNQTTATVEEVRQIVRHTDEKARSVLEGAQATAKRAEQGKNAVGSLIDQTGNIKERVESISETTIRLSEQGQAIGDIINNVNDIADQSNLLAVNAAIEAARAGEQGKGFAVVAQEIKALSDQSKQATIRVRTILTNVQKGTSGAVMATEQGIKAVEIAIKESARAGEAINDLQSSVNEATQAATVITASSRQQIIGMDQVASAMENIKQASLQNASSSKQAETAAKNLNDMAQRLRQLVEKNRAGNRTT